VSILAGYLAYLPAEELGVSGVLAAVTVGLTVGYRAPMLSSSAGRLSGYAFWDVVVFLLNATLFVLIGFQLPGIVEQQDRSTGTLVALGALAGGVVIITRLAWQNTVPFVIRALDRRPSQLERRIGWRSRMVISWSGMRGAVSLAAALAIPATTGSGAPFPERDLLVFLAIAVIFATLVLQGLTLPALITKLGVVEDEATAREQQEARETATEAALARLDELRDEPWIRGEALDRMVGLYDFRRRRLAQRVGDHDEEEDLEDRSVAYQRLVREVLQAQRRAVVSLRDHGAISDEVMREVERELDLEDERLEI
jgi:Na+/H+ antiporter